MVDNIIAAVAKHNSPPLPPAHVRGFDNGSLIDAFLLAHPNTALAAVEFTVDSAQSIGFAVQTNSSVQWFKGKFQDPNLYAQLPVQAAVEREIVRALADRPDAEWSVALAAFPHPSAKVGLLAWKLRCSATAIERCHAGLTAPLPTARLQSPSAISKFAPTFIFASVMFCFVLQLHDILHEKESGVRRLMRVMGLKCALLLAACTARAIRYSHL